MFQDLVNWVKGPCLPWLSRICQTPDFNVETLGNVHTSGIRITVNIQHHFASLTKAISQENRISNKYQKRRNKIYVIMKNTNELQFIREVSKVARVRNIVKSIILCI